LCLCFSVTLVLSVPIYSGCQVYTVSFTVLQPVVGTVACIKHVWYLQPNVQHTRSVYSHAIGVNTSCKFGTLWPAGCWPPYATSRWHVGVFTLHHVTGTGGDDDILITCDIVEYGRLRAFDWRNPQIRSDLEVRSLRLREIWAAFGRLEEDFFGTGKRLFIIPRPGALSDDAVWHLSVWRLSRTSGRRAACAAGRLDGAYWLIGPGSAGLAQGCRCTLPLQARAGAYLGGRPPTACYSTVHFAQITY